MKKRILVTLSAICALTGNVSVADDLARSVASPPPSARPWVYWFPLDGTISSNGITADLEAMKRVGIAGVLWMEVSGMSWAPDRLDSASPRIVNLNCWNEWTEGSYLDPDQRNGMKYLEAVREVFGAPPKTK
jgi:hypothetical protein